MKYNIFFIFYIFFLLNVYSAPITPSPIPCTNLLGNKLNSDSDMQLISIPPRGRGPNRIYSI